MLSLNRFHLKGKVKGNQGAQRSATLLERPERLITLVLLGNNLVNVLASAIATILAVRWLGDYGILAVSVGLTLVLLIFAEITPKTVAALRPETIAFPASYILLPLLRVTKPLIWLINRATNRFSRAFGVNPEDYQAPQMNLRELHAIIDQNRKDLPVLERDLLFNLMAFEDATVNHVMIPRNDIKGLDIADNQDNILKNICNSEFNLLPVFEEEINQLKGVLYRPSCLSLLGSSEFNLKWLEKNLDEPFYVVENTKLSTLLISFREHKYRFAFVVDEYGTVVGLVTLQDILEEIMGVLSMENPPIGEMKRLRQDTYTISGATHIRDINRNLNWSLPDKGPSTLNGLIIEHLQELPEGNACVEIAGYRIEIKNIQDQLIVSAHITAPKKEESTGEATGDETVTAP